LAGAIGVGNMTPSAEWNVLIDPHAAHIVFSQTSVPVYLITIEISHQNLVTEQRLVQVSAAVGPQRPRLNAILKSLLTFFGDTYRREFNMPHPPLHDPLAMLAAILPAAELDSVFKFTQRRVEVETSLASICVGRTVIDSFGRSKKPATVWVCDSVDVDAFWRHMCDAIRAIPGD